MSDYPFGRYHAKRGFFFDRHANGDVAVHIETMEGKLVTGITLTASEWASVVASVSQRGETGESHAAALAFHAADPPLPNPDPED